MTPERYRQVGDLYHAALDVEPDKRAAFLAEACAGDAELRNEVESLIASNEQAADFIASPALAVAAELLAQTDDDALIGKTIARYRILSLIGVGGMGRVYLAEDTTLGRRVALKFLPEYFTNDKNQVQRFRQEARAASALNHPNILTVYEVGQVGGTEFIATEYVDGETLRARLKTVSFTPREALSIAIQIADALIAAHDAGIVHRDIKPENVMLRRDGYVKVLDFGLAKLTENLTATSTTKTASTALPIKTSPGVVMGTAEYMSPEQTRGLSVDARTDVWSLGVVIYEMVTGQRPFAAATHGDTVVSVLERDPIPLRQNAPTAPEELETIVTKALAKQVDERYQTIRTLSADLRAIHRRLEVEAEIERATTTGFISSEGRTISSQLVVSGSTVGARVSEREAARATNSVEHLVSEIKNHTRKFVLISTLLILFVAGGVYGGYWFVHRAATDQAAPFQQIKITPITSDGSARLAAISSDGRYVAYVTRIGEKESLRVRQIVTSSDLLIIPPIESLYIGLTFSPDGNYLYYVRVDSNIPIPLIDETDVSGTLYQVPVLGGGPQKLLTNVNSPVTLSPDSKMFAFVRLYPERGESSLIVANADGSGERIIATRKRPDIFVGEIGAGTSAAWSPDGKVIACGVGRFGQQSVTAVSVMDGTEKPIGSRTWRALGPITWLPDGSGLIMVASVTPAAALWELSYPSGEAREITTDLNAYFGASLSADAASLVTVQTEVPTEHMWVATPSGDPSNARKITSVRWFADALSWTSDGRIVYSAIADGISNLWVINQDGTEQKQLTAFTNSANWRPNVSADGRYIVFVSDRAGPRNIWRVNIDGTDPVRLTQGELDTRATCSPDGRWVVYTSQALDKHLLRKVSIDGGEPISLASTNPVAPSVSPDGKLIAYLYHNEEMPAPARLVIIPFDGGEPVKTFDLDRNASADVPVRWTPDGHAVSYAEERDGVFNIWNQPLDGGTPKQVTDFTSDQIFAFDWSRDGRQLALWRGTVTRNVVLIRNER